MPTINQLVRKGREKTTNKSTALPSEARRLPERQDDDAQEAELRSS